MSDNTPKKRQYCIAFTLDKTYIVTENAPLLASETKRMPMSRKFFADLWRNKRKRERDTRPGGGER